MIGRLRLSGRRAGLIRLAGAVLLLAAIVLGWRAGHLRAPGDIGVVPAPWALPQRQSSDAEADAAILRARRPWGGSAAFSDPEVVRPAPAAPSWRLVGTVERDDGRFALIEIGTQPGARLEYRGIGEQLPDSSVVMQIDPDSITTQGGAGLPAGPIVYRLFQKKT